jgi:hypothetical protein
VNREHPAVVRSQRWRERVTLLITEYDAKMTARPDQRGPLIGLFHDQLHALDHELDSGGYDEAQRDGREADRG